MGVAASAASGETWLVDDDGPANFRDLPAAAAAALDGDTLLLRPGRYSPVALQHKGLRIIGCGAGLVTIERARGDGPFFTAKELSARQTLVLSGVTGIGRGGTIEISRCSGLVLLTDLVVECRPGGGACAGPVLNECGNALLARVAIVPDDPATSAGACGLSLQHGNYSLSQVVAIGGTGAPGYSPHGHGGAGGVGLAVQDANVTISRCEFIGGAGGAALWSERSPFCPEAASAGIGGAGISITGASEILAAGDGNQRMRGGDGGDGALNPWDNCWSFAGDAGSGARMPVDGIERRIAFSGVKGEAGTPGVGSPTRAGREGREIDGDPAAIEVATPLLPTLAVDEPGVSGGAITVRVRGVPGDAVSFIVSSEFGRVKLKSTKGFPLQALPGGYWVVYRVGQIGEDGELVIRTQLPSDKPLVGRSFALQALVTPSVRAKRDAVLTNVEVLTIADGARLAAATLRR